MSRYKLFLMRDGAPVRQVERECADDLDALAAARDLCAEHAVELWQDDRLIARVKRNDEPLNVRDSALG
jgi:hypothetical protein